MVKSDEKRLYLEYPDSAGDNLTATAYGKDGDVSIRIEEPWAGDTESGFGGVCGMTLKRDDAIALAKWILFVAR